MSAGVYETVRWNARRWVYTIALVFLAQVGIIWLLGERPKDPPARLAFQTAIYLAVDPWAEQQLAGLPTMRDPTLFVLPSRHGFSGAAWLTFAPQQYQLTDWTEPPRWLELNQEQLGRTFFQFVATNVTPPLRIADKAMPRSIVTELSIPNLPVPTQSELRVEGDLARRRLLTSAELPSWPHSELLTNTVVQAVVDSQGHTFSKVLLASCGSKEADQFALKLVAGARFAPIRTEKPAQNSAGQLAWGRIIFQWHTLPPSAANASAAQP
jgi:hypothetical protein